VPPERENHVMPCSHCMRTSASCGEHGEGTAWQVVQMGVGKGKERDNLEADETDRRLASRSRPPTGAAKGAQRKEEVKVTVCHQKS